MSRSSFVHLGRRAVLAGFALSTLLRRVADALPLPSLNRVRPGQPGWPDVDQWASLSRDVGGRLAAVTLPSLDPPEAPRLLSNPFFLRDQPGLTQSSGSLDAWRSTPSAYVVRARDAADVSAAVRFAATHRLRLVVKGGGHSFLGGSNAPDSLLVWTRDMDSITLHVSFTPKGADAPAGSAVSVGAGCIWGYVYATVTPGAGRYVQGGGCTTVGVAGLVQGGGFGSFSKRYGLAAASLLEAEVVTADGAVRTVSAACEPDLFWALKGGGGGTFGVVTRLTLQTHDLPARFGFVHWSVRATSDAAFRLLLERFADLYAERLFNPHWGEQACARPGNRLDVTMLFQGLDEATARDAWQPLTEFVTAHPEEYQEQDKLVIATIPARRMWDGSFLREHLPTAVAFDVRPGASEGDWCWAGDMEDVGAFWHGYGSAWLPATLLAAGQRGRLAQLLFEASRHWPVTLHFNKGLAGAPAEAIEASRDTAMNPQVLDAFALAVAAMAGPGAFPGQPAPDLAAARANAVRIHAAMQALRQAAPGAGSYLSECDFALPNWQEACWGANWKRLDRIKQAYDPDGLFFVHHGIGSEGWTADGFDRLG